MKEEDTRHFYDAIAGQSFDDWFDNPALLPVLRIFAGDLPKNPRVLDLGCGTGGESRRLSSLGARVTGVDFSGKSIELAREHVPEAEFILADILSVEFEPGSFDGILDAATLFHFNETDQDRILEKLFRALTPEGRFLSFYPEGEFEGVQDITVAGRTFRRYARLMSPGDWTGQVCGHGFTLARRHECSVSTFRCMEFVRINKRESFY